MWLVASDKFDYCESKQLKHPLTFLPPFICHLSPQTPQASPIHSKSVCQTIPQLTTNHILPILSWISTFPGWVGGVGNKRN